MLTPDGNLPHIRSKTTGLSFDTGEVPGGEYFLTGTNGFFDVAPDLAERGDVARRCAARQPRWSALRDRVVDGVLPLELEPKPERNTLIVTAVPEWTRLVGGARLVGDEDLAQAALRGMEQACGTGERWPQRPLHAGAQTIGIHLLLRWATPLSSADLVLRGYRAPQGPILASVPGPDVLVTKARSHDGARLDLRLHRLAPGASSESLRFEALTPGARYRLERARRGRDPRRRTRRCGHRRSSTSKAGSTCCWSRRCRRDPQHRQVVDAARRPEGQDPPAPAGHP